MEWLAVDVALWVNNNISLLLYLASILIGFVVGYALSMLHTYFENN